jgi:mannose-6-phosphate isomerase-like protein (cupin superfamily)
MKIFILCLLFTANACALDGPLQTGWQGQDVCVKLSENEYEQILRCTFPPGVGHEKHRHNANFGYALAGGKMQIADEKGTRTVDLKTNSYFDSTGTQWHQILNVGDTTVVYLIIEKKNK